VRTGSRDALGLSPFASLLFYFSESSDPGQSSNSNLFLNISSLFEFHFFYFSETFVLMFPRAGYFIA